MAQVTTMSAGAAAHGSVAIAISHLMAMTKLQTATLVLALAAGAAPTEGVSSNCVGTTVAGGVCGPAPSTTTTVDGGARGKRRRDE